MEETDSGQHLVFISHSSSDKERAVSIAAQLRRRGLAIWIDNERIKYGHSIPAAIELGLDSSTAVIVLLSKAFSDSSWCRAEYEPLLTKEIESNSLRVIPILLEDCKIPTLLRAKRYVDLRRSSDESSYDFYSREGGVLTELAEQIKQASIPTSENSDQESSASSWDTLTAMRLLEEGRRQENHSAGIELLADVSELVEKFEHSIDELAFTLERTGFGYGSANRLSQYALMRLNRKLVTTFNEMRAIYDSIASRFQLSPEIAEAVETIADSCYQIAAMEDMLTVTALDASQVAGLSAEQAHMLLDGRHLFQGRGRIILHSSAKSHSGLEAFHRMLVVLNDLKIGLREAVIQLEREHRAAEWRRLQERNRHS